jgi:hypothetical protein
MRGQLIFAAASVKPQPSLPSQKMLR